MNAYYPIYHLNLFQHNAISDCYRCGRCLRQEGLVCEKHGGLHYIVVDDTGEYAKYIDERGRHVWNWCDQSAHIPVLHACRECAEKKIHSMRIKKREDLLWSIPGAWLRATEGEHWCGRSHRWDKEKKALYCFQMVAQMFGITIDSVIGQLRQTRGDRDLSQDDILGFIERCRAAAHAHSAHSPR